MWTYAIMVIISIILMFGMASCAPGQGRLLNFHETDSLFYPPDTSREKASRAEIHDRLMALAESKAPEELNPGAMCYEVAMPPDRKEYVCPVCGEKTIYTNESQFSIIDNVNSCRSWITSIRGLDLRLEEYNFCHHCQPDTNQVPGYKIFIRYKGEPNEEELKNAGAGSLQFIYEFMNGDKTHSDYYDNETPLKDYIGTISGFFGIDTSTLKKD